MVGAFGGSALRCHVESVVVVGAEGLCYSHAVTDLKTFDRADGQDGMSENGGQLVEVGLPQADGKAFDDTFHRAAAGILALHALLQHGSGLVRSRGVWHIQGIVVNFLHGKTGVVDAYRADGAGIRKKRDAQFAKELHSNGTGCHPGNGLSGGGTAAAPIVPETIFLIIGIVRMSGPVVAGNLAVVGGSLGFVVYDHGNGGAGGPTLKRTGQDLHSVILFSGRGIAGLAGLAAV